MKFLEEPFSEEEVHALLLVTDIAADVAKPRALMVTLLFVNVSKRDGQ